METMMSAKIPSLDRCYLTGRGEGGAGSGERVRGP